MSSIEQEAVARVREALAEDPRTNALDVQVRATEDGLLLLGELATDQRRGEVEQVARGAVPPGFGVINQTRVVSYPPPRRVRRKGAALRVAAVGDVHVGRDSAGLLRPRLERLERHADVLLLAGDLTQHGSADEARVLADELRALPVPCVAILGNHDYHADAQGPIRAHLEEAGVHVLEGEHVQLELRGTLLGVAGVKGFGTGFAGACGSEFGEPEMKAFVRHAKVHAQRLEDALRAVADCDVRVALTHYSPVADTLEGERREIYPFLGSYLLAEAIDAAGCDLALHGHAHRGSEHGVTAGGVPVRNVAMPVIRQAYRVYRVEAGAGVWVIDAAA